MLRIDKTTLTLLALMIVCRTRPNLQIYVHEEAQLDVERREKNINHRRTMKMWKISVERVWKNRPIEEVRKLIDRQPKVMQAIIDAEGGRTSY